jgi:hypothetical protein
MLHLHGVQRQSARLTFFSFATEKFAIGRRALISARVATQRCS